MTSKAVNVPTDTKVKEQDINAKLQLYGIYSGMFARLDELATYPPLTCDYSFR